jgi:site-specific DNA-methyltransferase (adenine-specific)
MASVARPGQVRDAIIAYLRARGDEGATLEQIRNAVNKSIGTGVPASSVRSYLNNNTPDMFTRTQRGHYKLIERS